MVLIIVAFCVIHSVYKALPSQGLMSQEQDVLSRPLAVILSVMVALPWILVTSSIQLEFLQKYVPKLYKNFMVMFTLTESLLMKLEPR